jgi:Fe-S cluster biogenesis protein NfuA
VPALREAATDEIVYAVLRHHGIVKPSLSERIEAALDGVRPLLAGHGGNVELVRVEPPAISIRFLGACDNCPASRLTIDAAVKTAVQAACPEITDIIQVRA